MDLKNKPSDVVVENSAPFRGSEKPDASASGARLGVMLVVLVACFSVPLYRLAVFAAASELYSFILLMPVVCGYLIRIKRPLPGINEQPARGLAALFFAAGAIVLAAYFLVLRSHPKLIIDDRLAYTTLSFLLFAVGVFAWCLGVRAFKAISFPLAMLIFMVPIPPDLLENIDIFLQYGSAIVVQGMFTITGMPFYRKELDLFLPGVTLHVAPECSGIHSTLILFITSLLAGHLFLRSPWKRAIFTLCIIPLALIRNGFRIFTLGELCVHISPDMLHHWIHTRGGPIFFALSLIPFFLLLLVLQKTDRNMRKPIISTIPDNTI